MDLSIKRDSNDEIQARIIPENKESVNQFEESKPQVENINELTNREQTHSSCINPVEMESVLDLSMKGSSEKTDDIKINNSFPIDKAAENLKGEEEPTKDKKCEFDESVNNFEGNENDELATSEQLTDCADNTTNTNNINKEFDLKDLKEEDVKVDCKEVVDQPELLNLEEEETEQQEKKIEEVNEMKTEIKVDEGITDLPNVEEMQTEEPTVETKKEVDANEENVQEKEEECEEQSISMPPENLFEYQWPPEKLGEWYFVQEQISEYLGVTSFKRKYPDLERRVMEMKEKEFLRERGVVTEEQVTLGLTALKSEDVYDLMAKDYNKKYTDFLKVLQEKERQNISNKHKEYEATNMDKEKVKEFTKRAVKQAADYNASLMRERREERQYFLDMQTMVVQVSKKRVKQTKKEPTKVDGYPVALIPGQFQNFYRRYNPEELNYFPLQTSLYGPVDLLDQQRLGRPGWEDEDQPVSDISDPGSPEHSQPAVPVTNIPPPVMNIVSVPPPKEPVLLMPYKTIPVQSAICSQPKEIDDAICGLCLKDKTCNKFNIPEELIHCAQCDNSGHPSCLEMNDDLVNVIKTYPWQCMECKTCFCCGQPTDEDKMMFCDDCDRGYHTFCVGLQEIPTGKWACRSCLSAQAKEKELAAAALIAAAAAATPTPDLVVMNTPTATPPPTKRRRTAKKREF